ncbi:Putative glutathione S-transferase [Sodalis praecaptivus]|uniref:Putative glutathione S-transferase n=1 Tax=Sodalis praecaptivus TaxID=1239307 RepID=W0HZU9_9GAMM|nr:glutathione S-transferase [Sodalis praecaptivus]AHF77703.1 Putative glutathione S-transferase [Sodalis praecaptivus]
MLTIWGRENSVNVKKVLWCAAELQLVFNFIPAGGQYGKNQDAPFLSLNPNGLVPCLQDDENDLVLWESNTIVRYLAARYGQDVWLLSDAAERARNEKWMDWTLSLLAPALQPLFVSLVRTPAKQRDPAAIERGIAACEKLFAIADGALEKQPWFAGDAFGIGDIPLGCLAYNWFNLAIERQPRPRLEAWYQALCERTAYQQRVMLPLS